MCVGVVIPLLVHLFWTLSRISRGHTGRRLTKMNRLFTLAFTLSHIFGVDCKHKAIHSHTLVMGSNSYPRTWHPPRARHSIGSIFSQNSHACILDWRVGSRFPFYFQTYITSLVAMQLCLFSNLSPTFHLLLPLVSRYENLPSGILGSWWPTAMPWKRRPTRTLVFTGQGTTFPFPFLPSTCFQSWLPSLRGTESSSSRPRYVSMVV